jgi:hypothetical protein
MCIICDNEPGSHSFYKINTINNINIFYTCPAKATKYWDTKGILAHYEEVLEENGENEWIWIFDSHLFGFKHSLEISTALGILKLLKHKYGKYLKEIRIINNSIYIKSFYNLLYPFIPNKIIKIIRWG